MLIHIDVVPISAFYNCLSASTHMYIDRYVQQDQILASAHNSHIGFCLIIGFALQVCVRGLKAIPLSVVLSMHYINLLLGSLHRPFP